MMQIVSWILSYAFWFTLVSSMESHNAKVPSESINQYVTIEVSNSTVETQVEKTNETAPVFVTKNQEDELSDEEKALHAFLLEMKKQNKELSSDSEEKGVGANNWTLKFDPNYFASLNAANHRPVPESSLNKTDTEASTFYFSPESYGKASHKNHQNPAFSYKYPSRNSKRQPTVPTVSPTAEQEPSKTNYLEKYSGQYHQNKNPEVNQSTAEQTARQKYSKPGTDGDPFEDPFVYDAIQDHLNSKYYTSSSTSSKNRDKPTASRPYWYPDTAGSQSGTDYAEEDYDASELYSDFKHYPGSRRPPTRHRIGNGSPYYSPYYAPPYFAGSHPYPVIAGPDDIHRHQGDGKPGGLSGSSLGIASLLLGVIPLGILLASLVPAFVSVPVAASAGFGRKKRGIEDKLTIIEKLLNQSQLVGQRQIQHWNSTFLQSDNKQKGKAFKHLHH